MRILNFYPVNSNRVLDLNFVAPMHLPDFKTIGSVTLILFSVIDILGSIPVILEQKKKTGSLEPIKVTLAAGAIMFGFLYLGEKILKLFGVDIQSFALAGAIVILIMGMEMLLGRKFFKESGSDPAGGWAVPLAFPIIAGAGTMTTLVSLRSQYSLETILLGIVINLILVYLVLSSAQWLEDKIGDAGLKVMGKVFGIVLLAISIKIITAQLAQVKTNLQATVEKIEKTVLNIEAMHERNLRLMIRQDSILTSKDTVVVSRILRR
jgi:multiple antibiotic resistance protein